MQTKSKVFTLLLSTAILSACGGGGSSSGDSANPPATAATPILTLNPVKTLHFGWADVPGASHYKLLENPDGVSGFSQVGNDINRGVQRIEHLAPLYARLNAQYVLQSCNANGCIDSAILSVSGSLASGIGYFKAGNSGAMDLFGLSVSLSDDGGTLAVGAYAEDSNAVGINGNGDNNFATNSGAVYVFIRNESGWTQQAYIKSSNAEAYDLFGYTVSLSADGNTLAVGAEEEDSNAVGINGNEADNSASASGAAYIFTRTGTTWSQQAYIKASNPGPADLFGESVSLSADGNVLAVGAVGEQSNATGVNGDQTDNTLFMAGATYIFVRNGTSWSQQAYLKASNTDEGDRFGRPVRINASGDVLAIGADGESSNATGINGDQADDSLSLAGAVYIFSRSGATWSQQAYVKASNTDEADLFGTALSLNAQGTVLAVGAEGESSDAVGLNGDQNNNNAFGAGAAYLFTRSGSTWSQQAYIKAANAKPESAFGSSVSLNSDGDILAIGAALENGNGIGINIDPDDSSATNAGAAYVFTRSGTTWSQQAYLKASNTNAEDRFGSVNLSGDGQTLAVGAWREASDANGINADQDDNSAAEAGAVYLY